MDTNFAHYRKLVALLVTGAIVYVMHVYGLKPSDLRVYGLDIGGIAGPIVDYLILYGLPGAFVAAQPDGDGDSVFRHWRWWVAGIVIVIVLIAVVYLVGGVASLAGG